MHSVREQTILFLDFFISTHPLSFCSHVTAASPEPDAKYHVSITLSPSEFMRGFSLVSMSLCAAMWSQCQWHQKAGGGRFPHHRGGGLHTQEGAAQHQRHQWGQSWQNPSKKQRLDCPDTILVRRKMNLVIFDIGSVLILDTHMCVYTVRVINEG